MTSDNVQGLETLEAWKRAKTGANEPGAGSIAREESALYTLDSSEDADSSENQ